MSLSSHVQELKKKHKSLSSAVEHAQQAPSSNTLRIMELNRKFLQTGTLKKLRANKQYLKPNERNRIKMQKAAYSDARLREME